MSLEQIPTDLPVPKDDGACVHLTGMKFPNIEFSCTDGSKINISKQTGSLVYLYLPDDGTT